jgi:hypothetical protein
MNAENATETYKLHWWFLANKLFPWMFLVFLLVLIEPITELVPLVHDTYERFYYHAAALIVMLMAIGFVIGFVLDAGR